MNRFTFSNPMAEWEAFENRCGEELKEREKGRKALIYLELQALESKKQELTSSEYSFRKSELQRALYGLNLCNL